MRNGLDRSQKRWEAYRMIEKHAMAFEMVFVKCNVDFFPTPIE